MNLDAIRVDVAKINDGVWFEAGLLEPRLEGLRLKVRGLNCVEDRRVTGREMDCLPRYAKQAGRSLDPETEDAIAARRAVDALLVDWQGLTGDDGEPAPYSREMAERYLSDPDYGTLRDLVFKIAALVGAGYTGEG